MAPLARPHRGSSSPRASRPISASLIASVRALWVEHDPMQFLDGGAGESEETYEHQAYVMGLCLNEIHSESDAGKVVTTILRAEFGFGGSRWADAEYCARSQALAASVFALVREENEREITGVYPIR